MFIEQAVTLLKMTAKLVQWISRLSNTSQIPWPSSGADESPISGDALIADPTAHFKELTDEFDEYSGSEDEEEELLEEKDEFTYHGTKDEKGFFHGGGTITFKNGDIVMCDFEHGVRNGEAVVVSPRNKLSRLIGTYINGLLQGRGKMISVDTSVTECFFKDSVIHGLVRRFDMKKFREFRQQLAFVGAYRNGRPWGPCWSYREGGGFVVGMVDEMGELTGKNIAYVYPDMVTAWIGEFKNGRMLRGRKTRIRNVEFEDEILIPRFDSPLGEAVGFSKSSKTSMGDDLLVPDPYEETHVVCRSSDVDGAGEGLFAVQDLPAGEIAAFYNGVRIPFAFGGPKEEWATSGYKIFVNADFTSGERMNIPPEYESLNSYCATLGHKMNHSFTPNCVEWFFDHPRFGVIPCLRTTRLVKAGEELFLDYEYDPYNCPDWFREALISFVTNADEDDLEALNIRYIQFVKNECHAGMSRDTN